MASWAQLELIRNLWREFTRHRYDGEDELCKWLLRTFRVSSLLFLTSETARKAITTLLAMKRQTQAKPAAATKPAA